MIRSQIMKAGLSVVALMLLLSSGPALQAGVSKDAASKYLKDVQTGNPGLKSVGKITFGPGGLLVVADPAKATITVIDTHDAGPLQKLEQKVPQIDVAVAASLRRPRQARSAIRSSHQPAVGPSRPARPCLRTRRYSQAPCRPTGRADTSADG